MDSYTAPPLAVAFPSHQPQLPLNTTSGGHSYGTLFLLVHRLVRQQLPSSSTIT